MIEEIDGRREGRGLGNLLQEAAKVPDRLAGRTPPERQAGQQPGKVVLAEGAVRHPSAALEASPQPAPDRPGHAQGGRRQDLVASGVHEDEPGDPRIQHLGEVGGALHQDHAAHRVPSDHRTAQVEVLQHGDHVPGCRLPPESLGPCPRTAVPPDVHGQHPVAVGQHVQLRGPHRSLKGDAMDQEQRAALPALEDVDRTTIDGVDLVVGHVGGQVVEGIQAGIGSSLDGGGCSV